ncbi:hypothetical protein BROUX41_002717 [Berkeleyomyces rouxiae]|uniref:uncharacterized protein n=1 Tax=Berkeleyomyces rouxiae TaxID=2035830 RepID=UPI003B7F5E80
MESSNSKHPESKRPRRSSQRQSGAISISGHRDSSADIVETAVFDALISDGQIRPGTAPQLPDVAPFSSDISTSAFAPAFASVSKSTPAPYVAPISNFRNSDANIRSSIAKAPPKTDYLALQTPGTSSQMQTNEMPSRAENSVPMLTNEFSLASETSSTPQAGPSHPYAMYQQGISDISMTEMPSGPQAPVQPQVVQGPSHPYGMFPQNVVPMNIEMPQQTTIPPVAGFASNVGYQRRIGPDGEESGLVGPFGYTEELPPYTRYPEQGHTAKSSSVDTPTSVTATTPGESSGSVSSAAPVVAQDTTPSSQETTTARAISASSSQNLPPTTSHAHASNTLSISVDTSESRATNLPLPAIDGAGGIGLATRDPEFASTNDLDRSHSAASRNSYASESSDHEINTAAKGISEKDTRKKSWQIKAQRKIGGVVPLWALVLVGVTLLIIGVILGAVIGTVTSKRKKNRPPEGFLNGLFRAQIVPLHSVPADTTPLVTGSYSIPPLMANSASASCLSDTIYSQAWSCNLPVPYQVNIDQGANPDNLKYLASLALPNNSIPGHFIWGNQPIHFPEVSLLNLINDTSEPTWGPAWWFNTTYDKVVIISEDRFPPYIPSRKMMPRDYYTLTSTDGSLATSSDAATPTDTGETTEVVTLTATVTADVSETATPTRGFKGGPDFGGNRVPCLKEGDQAWICTWPNTRLDFMVYPNQDNSLGHSGSSDSDESDFDLVYSASYSASFPSPTASDDVAAATGTSEAEADDGDSSSPFVRHGNPYPKVIKITEQHIDGPQNFPTCRKVQIINGGQDAIAVLDDNGQPIKVELIDIGEDGSHGPDRRSTLVGRDPSLGLNCGCSWTLS